jgi:hypothetical protein
MYSSEIKVQKSLVGDDGKKREHLMMMSSSDEQNIFLLCFVLFTDKYRCALDSLGDRPMR